MKKENREQRKQRWEETDRCFKMRERILAGAIELDDETYTGELLGKATFFQWAEPGAMGEPGRVIILTEDGLIYHGNYVYGKLTETVCDTVRTPWNEPHSGNRLLNLGMGNRLLIRKDRWERFAALIAPYLPIRSECYVHWLEIALSVNQQKENEEKQQQGDDQNVKRR